MVPLLASINSNLAVVHALPSRISSVGRALPQQPLCLVSEAAGLFSISRLLFQRFQELKQASYILGYYIVFTPLGNGQGIA
jgi:hypothetical protein